MSVNPEALTLMLIAGAAWGFVRLMTDICRAVSRWLNGDVR